MFSLFPLFLAIDRIRDSCKSSLKQKFVTILLVCCGTGLVTAVIGVPWLTNAVHTFGHFSWVISLSVTAIGYGLEIAMVLFVCFGVPTLFIRRRGIWELSLRLSYFLAVEPFCPRFFPWSFGGLAFVKFPWLDQLADVIGSPGLGIYNVGFSFLLLLIWRRKMDPLSVPIKTTRRLIVAYVMLWVVGLTYGACRIQYLENRINKGSPLHITAIQPNFSYQRLASDTLDYSIRIDNLRKLLEDSISALDKFPADTTVPKLIIWPESTYPAAYLKDITLQSLVKHFATIHQTSVLLHSVDWTESPSGRRFSSVAFLVGTDGEIKGRYNKISNIPFGEYIPAADFFPSYADWLRRHVPNLSEVERGKEATVFQLSPELRISSPICFDAFSSTIIRDMSRRGTQLAVNLSNLVWFGKTTASDHLELAIRWRAIENRIPVFLISNNGRSVFVNELGINISEQLGLFEKGSLSQTVFLKSHFSLYREYTWLIHIIFALIFVVVIFLSHVPAFQDTSC